VAGLNTWITKAITAVFVGLAGIFASLSPGIRAYKTKNSIWRIKKERISYSFPEMYIYNALRKFLVL
jgi:hypothetical protein